MTTSIPQRINRNPWEISLEFTRTYQSFAPTDTIRRELACLRVQFPACLEPIAEGDLLAGRMFHAPIGFSPEYVNQTGYYCEKARITAAIDSGAVAPALIEPLRHAMDFWRTNNTNYHIRQAYSPSLSAVLPTDDFNQPLIAMCLYRMGGPFLDYDKLLQLGLPGLAKEVRSSAACQKNDGEITHGLLGIIDLVRDCALAYAASARAQSADTNDANCQRLHEIAQTLEHIADHPPETFRQAMQLLWLYVIISGVLNIGRLDVALGDFLVRDLQANRLTEDQALTLTQGLWRLMNVRCPVYNGRVILGGQGRPNAQNADRFVKIAIEATRTLKLVLPQLTLRFDKTTDESIMRQAMDTIGEGCTFPMLYNDDVNVPAVAHAFNVPTEEAADYVPLGCGEYVINHRSMHTPSGAINLLKALEVTLHNGIDPTTGKQLGLPTGDFTAMKSFDELRQAYEKQVAHHVAALAEQQKVEYDIVGREAPFLTLSLLYDDCIARGAAIFSGGVRYLGGTLEAYGNVNTADSLTAIKEHVFDRRTITPAQLLQALAADFQGFERERRLLLSSPKFGNDNASADTMAQYIHEHVCHTTRNQAQPAGLHSYLIVVINNSMNTALGALTGASPDGRLARQPMANANNPVGGMDRNGITAMLNSLLKMDPTIHAGVVQNMKFSREMFTQQRSKLDAILKTYWAKGGTQAMITVVSKDQLEEAMKTPERYSNILVRVGGFSARFVELPRKVQEEILSRTLY